jgi:hypothetical protein
MFDTLAHDCEWFALSLHCATTIISDIAMTAIMIEAAAMK